MYIIKTFPNRETKQAESLYAAADLALVDLSTTRVEVWIHGILADINLQDLLNVLDDGKPIAPKVIEQTYLIKGAPMPAKKTTANGKYCPQQVTYHAYKDSVLKQITEQGFQADDDVFSVECQFFFPLPTTAFNKAGRLGRKGMKLVGQPKRSKPDSDNCQKTVMDALPFPDEGIWKMSGETLWGGDRIGCTIIRVRSYSL